MGFILVIHVIVCILLVIAILMQAGRGGGLTETFQSAESMFGTQTNAFMVRLTTGLAIVFLSTSLLFAFHSTKGAQSLMANKKFLPKASSKAQESETPVSVKVEAPKPLTNVAK
ncbi:MAG: preprotein translocase subunit SecG [Candidatus Omnitrophica bacterium]|nr:preprotein translocase subunit SecG [Candidatus Omnitrophota bacterium]